MKKFLTVALAIALVAVLFGPAMATDVTFSGHYKTQGFWAESLDLDSRSANDAFMTHRFRLQTRFGISDNLAVTTRFDALDGTQWGTNGADAESGGPNINFDRAWMSIKTADYGNFDIGRMAGGTWFNSVFDNDLQRDRVKWVYGGIENWTLFFIYDARVEADGGSYAGATAGRLGTYQTGMQSDQDRNDYYPAFVYKAENWSAGLLYGYIVDKTRPTQARALHLFDPGFKGQWGPLALQAEVVYLAGTADNDAAADIDFEAYGWNFEGTYDFGPAKVMLGGVFISGEDNDATTVAAWPFGTGDDWDYPLLILTGSDGPWCTQLGNGTGNLSQAGGGLGAGALLWYGGVSFMPMENVKLGANVGTSTADDTQSLGAGIDDDQGTELDLILDWQIYDNLSYHAVLAWYWAGDFFRDVGGIPDTNFDDSVGFFNRLQMNF